jgi:hypothetical protein
VLADVNSDEDGEALALEKTRGLIDESEDVDAAVYKMAAGPDGEEEDDDYETIIEKELDNWFN